MEQFIPLGEHLANHGITTEAWNLRGQGLDPVISRRGSTLDVDRLIQDTVDFLAFARTRHPDVPLIIAGDSMGAQLALLALADPKVQPSLAAGLLFVPVIALRQRNPEWLQSGLRAIGKFLPNLRLSPKWFVNRGPEAIPLSRVPERAAELEAAPYRLREFSISFLGNMGLLIEQALATGPRISKPVAQFSAGVDLFLSLEQSRAFFDTIASANKSYFSYPEAHHDLSARLRRRSGPSRCHDLARCASQKPAHPCFLMIAKTIAQASDRGDLLAATAENITRLLEKTSDPVAERTVVELLETKNWTELNDRFYRQLAFGTGGLRGRTIGRTVTSAERGDASPDVCPDHPCIGTNAMNFRNVSRATQGLVRYVRDWHADSQRSGRPAITIAHDTRHFSRAFAEFAARIITDLGCDVHLFEAARSTPQLSFAVRRTGSVAGINITASHNPPAYNGYKVYFADGGQIVEPHATGIIEQVNAITSETPDPVPASERGEIHSLGKANDEAYLDALETLILDPALLAAHPPRVVYSALHGVGGAIIEPLLARLGCPFTVVAEQAAPDGRFPTVSSPNPENAEALALAVSQAERENADLVIATDPDDDRLGAAARLTPGGPLAPLTGNQLGSLMAWYRAMKFFETGRLTAATAANGVIIKTFVTTDLQSAIAEKFGLRCPETLTGFKYIGEKLAQYEGTDTVFVFGGEESYGYSGADFVRDKDGNSAAAMLCEVASYARSRELTLHGLLDDLYEEFGYHHERTESLTLEGADGARQIRALVESYSANPPTQLADRNVAAVRNFALEDIHDVEGDLIPKESMMTFALSGGFRVAVRPSGTEPKIKYYLFGSAKPVSAERLENVKKSTAAQIDALWQALHTDALARIGHTPS